MHLAPALGRHDPVNAVTPGVTEMERFPMRKVVLVLLAVFGVFWMVTDPHGLAQSAQTAGGHGAALTGDFFTALITFVRDLE